MPIYEYRCKQCNNAFEVLVRSTEEESILRCPACEHREIERLLSSFSRPCAVGSSLKVNCDSKPGSFR
ncbi:MAG: zinc ribbon domain-containing protein [Syntrophobacteraceae bacterium]|nr:zinc ribbon domain-containing protein [Syntrophobacteraceae bacterium]